MDSATMTVRAQDHHLEDHHAGPAPTPMPMWVRRCTGCGHADLSAVAGQPALLPDHPWRCADCLGRAWTATAAELPLHSTARCPAAGWR